MAGIFTDRCSMSYAGSSAHWVIFAPVQIHLALRHKDTSVPRCITVNREPPLYAPHRLSKQLQPTQL